MNNIQESGERIGGEAGQALVETALTLPLLVLMLLGAVELARCAYAAIEVSNAAEAAVRYGSLNPTTAVDIQGIQLAAQTDAANLTIQTPDVRTVCGCSDGTGEGSACGGFKCTGSAAVEKTLVVNISASYDPIIHLPGTSGALTLRSRAVQKVLF